MRMPGLFIQSFYGVFVRRETAWSSQTIVTIVIITSYQFRCHNNYCLLNALLFLVYYYSCYRPASSHWKGDAARVDARSIFCRNLAVFCHNTWHTLLIPIHVICDPCKLETDFILSPYHHKGNRNPCFTMKDLGIDDLLWFRNKALRLNSGGTSLVNNNNNNNSSYL